MIDHISLSGLAAVAAPLNVGVPLAVAALGNVIDRVDVIDAVDDQGSRPRLIPSAGILHRQRLAKLPRRCAEELHQLGAVVHDVGQCVSVQCGEKRFPRFKQDRPQPTSGRDRAAVAVRIETFDQVGGVLQLQHEFTEQQSGRLVGESDPAVAPALRHQQAIGDHALCNHREMVAADAESRTDSSYGDGFVGMPG